MKPPRLVPLASLALILSNFVSLDASAVPLSYDRATDLVLAVLVDGGAGSGIAPIQAPRIDLSGAPVAGHMELDPVEGGEFDLTYSLSVFGDASPLVLSGSYGAAAIPVTLRIDEISYQSASERVTLGPMELRGTVAGLLRGSLTVGTATTPLSIATSGPALTDSAACDLCLLGRIDPAETRLGWEDPFGGTGLYSDLGSFSEEVTVDGTTFRIFATPSFTRLFYVPEPGAGALLALAAAALISLRARRLDARL